MLAKFEYDLHIFKMLHFKLNLVLFSFIFLMCLLSCVLFAFLHVGKRLYGCWIWFWK